MDLEAAFASLGVALGVGLLIGFEREQAAGEEKVGEAAEMGGVRTFPLVALAGAISTLLSRELGGWFVALVFAAFVALICISYFDDVRRRHQHGLTTEVAMLLTFLLGAAAPTEKLIEPASHKVVLLFSMAVVVTFVLSLKPPLHALVRRPDREDLLVRLLSELLARFELDGLYVESAACTPLEERGDAEWRAVLRCTGGRVDRSKEGGLVEVKAVTYHGLELRQESGRWRAQVFVDL